MSIKNVRTFFILPVCLLVLNALEEVAVYKLQDVIANKLLYVTALILMFALGFTLVGNLLAPWIEKTVEYFYKGSKKKGGDVGVAVFYWVVLAAVFVMYYVVYAQGPQFMLPASWR